MDYSTYASRIFVSKVIRNRQKRKNKSMDSSGSSEFGDLSEWRWCGCVTDYAWIYQRKAADGVS